MHIYSTLMTEKFIYLSEKEIPIPRWNVLRIPHSIEGYVMDVYASILRFFQVYQRNITGIDISLSDLDPGAVYHVIAVRFDDEARPIARSAFAPPVHALNQKGRQRGLPARMKMHFRLLDHQNSFSGTKYMYQDRKRLTYAITGIDQIDLWP